MSEKLKNIGIFGGSFNPPHQGHLEVVKRLASEPLFDELWLVPVLRHPFGKELAPFEHRLKLLELLLGDAQGLDKVRVCAAERDLDASPCYTIDLINHLQKEHPGTSFTIIVGSDAKAELHRWHRITELKKLAAFYFIPRKGYEASPFPEVSSSQIREAISKGEDISGFTPENVATYISANKLYR